jgi:hypothetical protein
MKHKRSFEQKLAPRNPLSSLSKNLTTSGFSPLPLPKKPQIPESPLNALTQTSSILSTSSRSSTPMELCSPNSAKSNTSNSSIDSNISALSDISQVSMVSTKSTDSNISQSSSSWKKYGSHIQFYFAANKVKDKLISKLETKCLTKEDIELSYKLIHKNDLEVLIKSTSWLIGRKYIHLSIDDDDINNIINQYREILVSIASFQFVLGYKRVLPIFTLGDQKYNEKYPIYQNNPVNKKFRFIIPDCDRSRYIISDLLLLLHAKSDVGDNNFTLLCGEILQRRGKMSYAANLYILVKLIYKTSDPTFDMENMIKTTAVEINCEEKDLKYFYTKENQIEEIVEWLVYY